MDGRKDWTAGLLGLDPKAPTSPRVGLEAETGERGGRVSGGRGRGCRGGKGLISPEATRTLHPASGPQALAEAQLAVISQVWDRKPESALLTKPRAVLQPRATLEPPPWAKGHTGLLPRPAPPLRLGDHFQRLFSALCHLHCSSAWLGAEPG